MALVSVHCPECQSIDVVQYGKQANGTQRYRCNNRTCPRTIFLLEAIRKPLRTVAARSRSILAVMKRRAIAGTEPVEHKMYTVSYTHLTLPTILLV